MLGDKHSRLVKPVRLKKEPIILICMAEGIPAKKKHVVASTAVR